MASIIHLLSGGLDSVTMLYDLHGQGHKVRGLLIDYKQPHVQELIFAKSHCRRLGLQWTTLEIPQLGGLSDGNWVVPNRNAIFISLAINVAVQEGADLVTIGCNADDAEMFPDCRRSFLASMAGAIDWAGYKVELQAPYLDWQKWKIAGLAREIGVPTNEIWSCYRGGTDPCGVCPACLKLQAALG